ncbi:Protein of unknown function wound-induced [Dillenia turbinata]|uniref:Uncharacterized protein n=1 Tax=Dillenia turbinata TaxID=194707 RepID=A0AAN8Z118_9MAGN
MSQFNRLWMAASVAVVQGHTDQGIRWKSGLRSFNTGKGRLFTEGSELGRPVIVGSDLGDLIENCNGEERRKHADESIRKVMYLSCWGQG